MKYFLMIMVIAASVFFTAPKAFADSDPVYTSWRNNDALGGYDTISFFSGKPLKGNDEFQMDYKGAVWSFSTRANLDLFKANPGAFAPQYGGYCAWAIAKGKLAKGSPKYWTVQDGRLFLNFNARVQENWNTGRNGFIKQADERWPNILID